jgi:hypothetical protein
MKCPFAQGPHHSVHHTLGVDTEATGPLSRVDSIEGRGIGNGEKRRAVTIFRSTSNHGKHHGSKASSILVFTWCYMLDSLGGLNLLLVVAVGCFLVSF